VNEKEFAHWLEGCSTEQIDSIRSLRNLIRTNTRGLEETINQGKWLHNYIFYSVDSKMVYAVAPKGKTLTTFHMMPYYGSEELQLKYQSELEPFMTGKSCLTFKNFTDLPYKSLTAIVKKGTKNFLEHTRS